MHKHFLVMKIDGHNFLVPLVLASEGKIEAEDETLTSWKFCNIVAHVGLESDSRTTN